MHTRRQFGVAVLAVAALALLLAGTGRAQAAFLSWGSAQNITSDFDVKTDGTLFGALNLGSAGLPPLSDATVNRVTFQAAAVPDLGGVASVTFGNFQFSDSFSVAFLLGNNVLGSSGSFFTSLSAGYQSLLSSAILDSAAGFTLTISNLTVGHQYEFEWWSNGSGMTNSLRETASDGAGNSVTLQSNTNATKGTVGLGQYAVGTFTADATSEVINYTASGYVNGAQLRDLGPAATAVPEPASLTLLATGALTLLGYGWRRRKQPAA